MARISRSKIDGHLSSRLSLAKSCRQKRRLEGSAKSHVGTRAHREAQVFLKIWVFSLAWPRRWRGAVRIFWRVLPRAGSALSARFFVCRRSAPHFLRFFCSPRDGGGICLMVPVGVRGPGESRREFAIHWRCSRSTGALSSESFPLLRLSRPAIQCSRFY